MRTVAVPACAALAAVLVTGCADRATTAGPSPTSSAVGDVSLTVDVKGDAGEGAEVLRSRLAALGLAPGQPRIEGRAVTFQVARPVTDQERAALAAPGLLAFRRVTEPLAPEAAVDGTPRGTCANAAYRARLAATAADPAHVAVVACASDGSAKYRLGAVEPAGAVKSATASRMTDSAGVSVGEWVVELTLADAGAWQRVTERATGVQLAIVVDGVVHAAPTVQEAISNGVAHVSGAFTEADAQALATTIARPLPAQVVVRPG